MALTEIAAVQVSLDALKEELEPVPVDEVQEGFVALRGRNGMPFLAKGLDDATMIHTGAPIRSVELDALGALVRSLLGDMLDRHGDERGIMVFPDRVVPKARSWTELTEEVGELADWAPVVADDFIPEGLMGASGGGLDAIAAELMGQLGPDVEALKAGDPNVMQRAMAGVQQMMQDDEKRAQLMGAVGELLQGLGPLGPGGGTGDGAAMPFDLGALQAQAQKLMADNPELAEGLLGGAAGAPDEDGDDDGDE